MDHGYADPVAKLVTHGKCDHERRNEPWPDYLALGFTKDHVPSLIEMVSDSTLNDAHPDSIEVWGPLHAWRTLAQLGAEEAVQPLVRLFENTEDDWLLQELPVVFSMIGPASIPALDAFLRDDAIDPLDRTAIPECLERIAKDHSTAAKTCVDVLLRQLEKHETNDPTLNAILVLALVNLETTKAIDAIRATFAKDRVDISVFGDLEDVEISLGIRKKRSTPRPRYNIFPDLAPLDADEFSDIPAIPVRRSAKIGRNDPCPCGSGKKYKKCCLRKNQSILAGEEKKPWTMLS